MAYRFNLGYRFQCNGSRGGGLECSEAVECKQRGTTFGLEGFTGTALSSSTAAYRDAIRKVRGKCEALGEPFDETRLVLNNEGISAADQKQLEVDCKISARSNLV